MTFIFTQIKEKESKLDGTTTKTKQKKKFENENGKKFVGNSLMAIGIVLHMFQGFLAHSETYKHTHIIICLMFASIDKTNETLCVREVH